MKTKYKVIFISSVCLLAIAIMTVLFIMFFTHSYKIDEITENRINDVVCITDENGEQLDLDSIKNELYSYTYHEYGGGKGNTVRVKYYFYDDNENCMFYIEDIGNQNLFSINIDGESTVYQATKSK